MTTTAYIVISVIHAVFSSLLVGYAIYTFEELKSRKARIESYVRMTEDKNHRINELVQEKLSREGDLRRANKKLQAVLDCVCDNS